MHPVAALFSIRPLGGKKNLPRRENGSGGLMGPAAVTGTKEACCGGEKLKLKPEPPPERLLLEVLSG